VAIFTTAMLVAFATPRLGFYRRLRRGKEKAVTTRLTTSTPPRLPPSPLRGYGGQAAATGDTLRMRGVARHP
jgi:hypothetical protein